jgi:ferredoxin-like protein FixX
MEAYKCPVCGGKGIVPNGFYFLIDEKTKIDGEKCLTCEGTGVIFLNGTNIFSFPKGRSSDLGDNENN